MTTISAKITGNKKDLEMFLTCGIRFNSTKKIKNNVLNVSWIHEESNYDVAFSETLNCISMRELELWNCKLESIN